MSLISRCSDLNRGMEHNKHQASAGRLGAGCSVLPVARDGEDRPMQAKDVVCGIGIVLTFALGVRNLVANYRNTPRANFINTVTAQRVKWIEQLRQDIPAYSGLTRTWCFSDLDVKPEELEVLKEIHRFRRVIRLRLNPAGAYDKRIEKLVERIRRSLTSTSATSSERRLKN